MLAASTQSTCERKDDTALPLQLDQPVSAGSLVAPGAFIAAAAAMLLTPFSMVLAHAATEPELFAQALDRPLVTLQLFGGLLIASAFVAIPLRRLVLRARSPSRIVVGSDGVVATAGTQALWSEPLSAYAGIAHHVRTSLSGTQHEIVLVHPEAAKSVVLHTAATVGKPQVEAMARLLKLAEVPPRALYSRSLRDDLARPSLAAA